MMKFLLMLVVVAVRSNANLLDTIPLNQYPFIMSHDAASGYLMRDHVVAEWTATQSDGLKEQLYCGSRGFDYRPYYFNGTVFAHHGPVKIPVPMAKSIAEIISWCNENKDELVVLYLNKCDGQDGCQEATVQLLNKFGIRTITDCSMLSTMTVRSAKVSSTLLTGGSLLAVYDCMIEQFDETINCYGASKETGTYSCYDDSTSDIPMAAMKKYLNDATSKLPTDDGRLWMAQVRINNIFMKLFIASHQGHWQSTAESVVLGTLHNSSILLDESRAKVNIWLSQLVRSSEEIPVLNILEVDNVCDGGLELLTALKERSLAMVAH